MEVSTEKIKTITNITNDIRANITMNDQKLKEVTSFRYLRATLCKDGSFSAEVRIRIASAIARLNRIWRCNIISFASQFKLYKYLITSILLYGCKTWALLGNSKKGSRLSKPNA